MYYVGKRFHFPPTATQKSYWSIPSRVFGLSVDRHTDVLRNFSDHHLSTTSIAQARGARLLRCQRNANNIEIGSDFCFRHYDKGFNMGVIESSIESWTHCCMKHCFYSDFLPNWRELDESGIPFPVAHLYFYLAIEWVGTTLQIASMSFLSLF